MRSASKSGPNTVPSLDLLTEALGGGAIYIQYDTTRPERSRWYLCWQRCRGRWCRDAPEVEARTLGQLIRKAARSMNHRKQARVALKEQS